MRESRQSSALVWKKTVWFAVAGGVYNLEIARRENAGPDAWMIAQQPE